jgi:hypothetical protein
MIRDGIYPFVESGIQLCDNLLFPLNPDKSKVVLRFFDRILRVTSTRSLTMQEKSSTYDGA